MADTERAQDNMHEWPLRLNHYSGQSIEHFIRVRSNRTIGFTTTNRDEGMVASAVRTLLRGAVDGTPWDLSNSTTVDDALAQKGHWRLLGRRCVPPRPLPDWQGLPMVAMVDGEPRDVERMAPHDGMFGLGGA